MNIVKSKKVDPETLKKFYSGEIDLLILEDTDTTTIDDFGELEAQDLYGTHAVPIGAHSEQKVALRQEEDQLWHNDRMYFKDIHPYVGLRCNKVDKGASPTYFCDMHAAWDSLPEDLKQNVRDEGEVDFSLANFFKRARYPYDVQKPAELRYLRITRKCKNTICKEDSRGEYAYFSPAYTSSKYYDELNELLFQDKFIYAHEWKDNDLVVWNNKTISHMRKGTPRHIVRNLVRYAFHESKQSVEYLTHLPLEYDRDILLQEVNELEYKPFEIKRAPKDSFFRYAESWLRGRVRTMKDDGQISSVVNQVKDLLDLEDKDFSLSGFIQKANTSVPEHKDLSPCAVLIMLSKNAAPITFAQHGDMNYQCALVNTQAAHSVKSYVEDRIVLKFSIQHKNYHDCVKLLNN